MKPLIGITSAEVKDHDHPWTPMVHGHCRTYMDAVITAGGIPVQMPITDDQDVLDELLSRLDGFLFSGGIDIDPASYEENRSDKVKECSNYQDNCELKLMRQVLAAKKPMLAICRGMQLLNIQYGGSLYQDIESALPEAVDHRASQRTGNLEELVHSLRIDQQSKLGSILGVENLGANSHHHQAVKRLGTGLMETAWAEDGIIEGIELPTHPFAVGVQFHPEEILVSEPRWKLLFEAFITSSKGASATLATPEPESLSEQFSVDLAR